MDKEALIHNVRFERSHDADTITTTKHTVLTRALSALFYAATSLLVVFINKIVLTNYKFPSYLTLGAGQMVGVLVVVFIGHTLKMTKIPSLSKQTIPKIFPLPIFYFVNLVTGLGGTKKLNLPMFTVMRRFSLLFILIGEYLFLKTKESLLVHLAIYSMIVGALVAAANDFSFELIGYVMIMVNNLATAANGICTKKKLNANDLGKNGLMFYNALFMLPLILATILFCEDINTIMAYTGWSDLFFVLLFIATCLCGFILNYATFLCTQYNSALTTSCVGTMKNIIATYGGMISSGDYFFSVWNFVGINISVVGSLLYAYATLFKGRVSV